MLYAASVNYLVLSASCLLVLAAVGCKKTAEPTTNPGAALLQPAPSGAHSTPSPAASAQAEGDLIWVDPPAWRRTQRGPSMRKATYIISHEKEEKDDAELGVFYFGPGQGGGIDANVDRWVKQFSDVPLDKVKRADRTANGLVQHTVEIDSGSFNVNMMGQGEARLKTGYALLGAIVEAPSGAYFFKLTGPEKTVAAARPTFYALLDSVKPKS